jgi:hypothetical protein
VRERQREKDGDDVHSCRDRVEHDHAGFAHHGRVGDAERAAAEPDQLEGEIRECAHDGHVSGQPSQRTLA